ncbi:MCP methyltransferase, CheR-type [Desulfofarcimen acetoxidans DSM 771]|uniref:MCP methyltransferase, CheR-type n=1 Tax=Desulfofarcimen acetoxidans (strain ATCC 49208 / DSM 771 / KCTC 5769 / VKM B-1644 / 5575) TaxID=485916 RepID=C8VX96_DESAS|nr:protein-glutamate O-methyltransferase CheR [Desulfofarcimen acetoxidans]ACV64492.1 MCP methyltransferase, CheR-type [Desulfofarcimen acetoxidans DSM 771]
MALPVSLFQGGSKLDITDESTIDVNRENQNIEIRLLLDAIYLKYGYDFRNYAKASIKRRILHRMAMSGLQSISEMQHLSLYDLDFFKKLLLDFSINVTEMFRDPSFYYSLRREIIPVLRTYPYIKIWHAGCATGEEVYSMVILLKEEGIYDRCQIYATDFNQVVLQKAKEGIFPIENIKEYTINYQKAGGKESFSSYYTAKYDSVIINQSLKKNILFADHNLVTDGVFGEMNLILCRNVLIYFDKILQNRVIGLFYDSLCRNGFLCLGSKESLMFSEYGRCFEDIVKEEKIYRKKSKY